eukprot:6307193-Karenia_brevis.AAC.1
MEWKQNVKAYPCRLAAMDKSSLQPKGHVFTHSPSPMQTSCVSDLGKPSWPLHAMFCLFTNVCNMHAIESLHLRASAFQRAWSLAELYAWMP